MFYLVLKGNTILSPKDTFIFAAGAEGVTRKIYVKENVYKR